MYILIKNAGGLKLKKIYIFIIIGLILLGGFLGFYFYKKNNSKNYNGSTLNDLPYNSTRVSSNENSNNSLTNTNVSPSDTNSENNNKTSETEISTFTTKIYTKDSDRQNNISITCSKLNDTTIENGETFSFCNTVGKATTSKGYKKADVFQDGEKIEALGRSEIVKLVQHYIMLFLKLMI